MTVKEYTEYVLNNYQKEIIETSYDQRGRRKNILRNIQKLDKLKKITQEVFKTNELKTELKYGLDFNFSDMPWIFIHDDYNIKATKQDYIGISFDKENKALELWIGFGKNDLLKKERKERQKLTIQRYKTICPTLERNFRYFPLYEEDATILSKSILLDEINDASIKKDLEYLEQIYLKYMDKYTINHSYLDSGLTNITEREEIQIVDLPQNKKIEGINIIYKGFPGTGKSYHVKNTYLTEKDNEGNIIYEGGKPKLINEYQYEIVVFHPEYTNSNFIGSILPVYDNGITYKFVPGPFTKILKRAIKNPKTNFYLIVEEINRGNCETIFGDILLLLDRENNGNGRSTYEITNEFIASEIYKDKNKKVYIPDNLSIIATMNSSDQNVCVLDTAFERRWETVWITDKQEEIDKLYIKGFGNLKWGDFRNIINTEIKNCTTMLQMEDKKLGAYFINNSFVSNNSSTKEKDRLRFTNKVLTYLFDNVCKYDKKLLFNDNIKCIDDLIKASINKDIIFNDTIINKIKDKTNE